MSGRKSTRNFLTAEQNLIVHNTILTIASEYVGREYNRQILEEIISRSEDKLIWQGYIVGKPNVSLETAEDRKIVGVKSISVNKAAFDAFIPTILKQQNDVFKQRNQRLAIHIDNDGIIHYDRNGDNPLYPLYKKQPEYDETSEPNYLSHSSRLQSYSSTPHLKENYYTKLINFVKSLFVQPRQIQSGRKMLKCKCHLPYRYSGLNILFDWLAIAGMVDKYEEAEKIHWKNEIERKPIKGRIAYLFRDRKYVKKAKQILKGYEKHE